MARAGSWITPSVSQRVASTTKPFFYFSPRATNYNNNKTLASLKGNDSSLRSNQRVSKRLVRISTAEGRWRGEWNCDYIFSLRDLQLEDLAENGHKDTQVTIHLCIHKHTGFGLSVEGEITTSFTTKCSNCYLPYNREINTSFKAWVLPTSNQKESTEDELPVLGCEDPSVIYVKPGSEADLDSLIQDTIRLATSVKETCSEVCETSEPKLLPLGKQNAASIDRRWSRLLELKKATFMKSQ